LNFDDEVDEEDAEMQRVTRARSSSNDIRVDGRKGSGLGTERPAFWRTQSP